MLKASYLCMMYSALLGLLIYIFAILCLCCNVCDLPVCVSLKVHMFFREISLRDKQYICIDNISIYFSLLYHVIGACRGD